MAEIREKVRWDEQTFNKYNEMIAKIPTFHKELAKQVVDKKAIINAVARNSDVVEEEDVARAFLTEVPKAFYSLMTRLMDEVQIDYKPYVKDGNNN